MTGNELFYEKIDSNPPIRVMARFMTQGEAVSGAANSNLNPGYAVYYQNGNSNWMCEELFEKTYRLTDGVRKYYQKSNPTKIIVAKKLPEPTGELIQLSKPGYQIFCKTGESFMINTTDFERQFQEMQP